MMQINEAHSKILAVIQRRGPCLPIHVAKELNLSTLFISAFLSELVDDKKIKISSLKVGGSPVYFLAGQESKVEDFYNYMHPKEAEAFLLLKERKIIKDREQEPAIRVALRLIKDFSFGFMVDNELYWRFHDTIEDDARNKVLSWKFKPEVKQEIKEPETPKKSEPIIEIANSPKLEIKEVIQGKKPVAKKLKENNFETIKTFENPLVIPEKIKEIKVRPKSSFVIKATEYIEKIGLKIIEEKEYKNKELLCITEIKSQLGSIHFYTLAKDKKSISESDFIALLSNAQRIPLPAFLLYTGSISKKASEYLKKYSSILKAKKIEL